MPDQAAEAIERVAAAVEHFTAVTGTMHAEVRRMNRRQQRQSWVLYLVGLAVVLLIIGSIVDYQERQEAEDARVAIGQVVDEIERATSPEAQRAGQQRVADAVATINRTNLAIALCEQEQAPNLEQCVLARVNPSIEEP